MPSKSSLSLLRGVSRFSSFPGRWSMTVWRVPTSLSAPWVGMGPTLDTYVSSSYAVTPASTRQTPAPT